MFGSVGQDVDRTEESHVRCAVILDDECSNMAGKWVIQNFSSSLALLSTF